MAADERSEPSEKTLPSKPHRVVGITLFIGVLCAIVGFVILTHSGRQSEDGYGMGTRLMMESLDYALNCYYEDWGKYPWMETTPDGRMGAVEVSLRPAAGTEDDAEAILYAALTAKLRHGPYTTEKQTVQRKTKSGTYTLFVDGWGRPIRYRLSEPGQNPPVLESEGADPRDSGDNLRNY
jgi:hypothetical protein